MNATVIDRVLVTLDTIRKIPESPDQASLEAKYEGVLRFLVYLDEYRTERHGREEVLRAYQEIPLESQLWIHNNGHLPKWINASETGEFIGYDPVTGR